MKKERRKNRQTLYLISVFFLAPFILSWWFLHFSDYVDIGKKSNYGALITPPRPLPVSTITRTAGDDSSGSLHGKWSLLYLLPHHCAAACKKTLYNLHQIEQAMGTHSFRVQRVALITDASALAVLNRYPGQWLFELDSAMLPAFLALLRLNSEEDPVTAGYVYIVDPQGSLIMRYAPDFDPYGLIKDLKKLLKASRIG